MASSGSANVHNTKDQKLKSAIFANVKSLSAIKDDENAYTKKITILVDLWKNVASFSESAPPKQTDRLVEWVYFQTVHLVLEAKWIDLADDQRTSMHRSVSNIINGIMRKTNNRVDDLTAFMNLLGLQNLIVNPWRHPTLVAMFRRRNKVTLDEVLAFLCSERGHLLVTRLDILCESRCEDMALKLAEASLKCIRLNGQYTLRTHVSQDQMYYIIDVYLALLHKYDRMQDFIKELNTLSMDEGLLCIRRFSCKQTNGIRIWKHCFKIAELAAQVFVVRALKLPHENGAKDMFYDLMVEWAFLQSKHRNHTCLPRMVSGLVQCAESAMHIYTMCKIINRQFDDIARVLVIELYIRAITSDMNTLEQHKIDKCTEKMKEIEARLSNGFLALGDLLKDEIGVCRECVLTAFSLNPNEECYKKIREMAVLSGKFKSFVPITKKQTLKNIETLDTGQLGEWKCHLHPPCNDLDSENIELDLCSECGEFRPKVTQADCSLDALMPITGHSMLKSAKYDVLSAPSHVLDPAVLKLPSDMCEDLSVVINSPRAKNLSWVHDWSQLSKACETYMKNGGFYQYDKELKFVKIDYDQFKDWPVKEEIIDKYYGIEKGYENFLVSQQDSEDLKNLNSSVSQDVKKVKEFPKSKVRILESEGSGSSNELKTVLFNSVYVTEMQSQDSPADSLGSDGVRRKSRKRKKVKSKTKRTSTPGNISHYSLPEIIEHSNLSVNKKLCAVRCDIMFNHDVNHIASILTSEKKSSDPKVLQSLRKYRPRVKSCASGKAEITETKTGEKVKQFDPELSELHLSPRVILNRHFDKKDVKKKICQISSLNNNSKIITEKIYCEINQRGNFEGKGNLNILAGVPGLSSFDMLIPEKVQPVVQIVQLAQNTSKQQPTSTAKVSRSPNQTNMTIVTSTPSTSTDINSVTIDSSPSQHEVLSTPVTPHIQRIGQATLNCDPAQIISPTVSVATTASQVNLQIPQTSSAALPDLVPASQSLDVRSVDSTVSTAATSQVSNTITSNPLSIRQRIANPSLANLLTNRIVMPAKSAGQSKNNPTIINVLSQKILRPPYSSSSNTNCTSMISTAQSIPLSVSNNPSATLSAIRQATSSPSIRSQSPITHLTSSSQTPQQLLQILNSPQKSSSSQVIKGVNLISSLSGQPESKMVQFICKTDGKTFQLTPFSTNPNVRIQQVDANRAFKTIPQTQVRPAETAANINTRSVYEENYAKFIQTANKISQVQNTTKQSNTILTTTVQNSNQNTSLPKFNQAFGKTAFHNNSSHGSSTDVGNESDTTISNNVAVANLPVIKTYKSDPSDSSILNTVVQNSINPVIIKRSQLPISASTVTTLAGTTSRAAMAPLSVQTVHSGVILTRQIPISAGVSKTVPIQTLPMVPVAIPSPVVVSKNSIIRNKVSTILTATFSPPVVSSNVDNSTNPTFTSQSQSDSCDANASEDNTRATVQQPLYALQTSLPIKLAVPSTTMFSNAKVVRPVVQIPSKLLTTTSPIKQQLVLTATPTSRMCQNVRLPDNLINTSSMDTSVSSSTLEQLREFDMVLEQVKERSTVQPNLPHPNSSPVSISTNVSHGLLIPHSQSEATETELATSNASFGQEVVFTTTVSPLAQRLSLTYMSQNLAKLAASAPVVVVTNYQQAPSPALSVTSQSSSSPCVTPAPTTPNSSAGKTPPKVSSKSKTKSIKTSSTNTSKASPIPKPPQKPQEDEQTAQRIYDILAEYAEQLRNSPDLNNKPAPRRRSNPSANPGQNSKRKKNSSSKRTSGQGTSTASEMSPGADDHHTMGSEDSSCGLIHISMQNSPSQGIPSVEDCLHGDTSSDVGNIRSVQSDSSECPTTEVHSQTPARHLIFTDPNNTQQRNVIIAEATVGEALAQVGKLGTSTAAVLVPGNYILPMSMVKGGQQITIVSGGSKILATVPGRPGTNANALVLQSIINQAQKQQPVQQSSTGVKIPTVQTMSGLTHHTISGNQTAIIQSMSTSQLNQQISYIDPIPDKNSTTSSATSRNAIFLDSNPSMNVIRSSPSKSCSNNVVTNLISKTPVVRTYSALTHTSGTNNTPDLTQTELIKVKDNFSADENNKLKLNIISDVSTIVSANNSAAETRYTLSITPQTVLCQTTSQAGHSLTDSKITAAKASLKQRVIKDSNVNNQAQLIVPVESNNAPSNPIIKLVQAPGRSTQSVNSTEIFTSEISEDERPHSILINTNENIINGPLLSQISNTVYQSPPSNVNASLNTVEGTAGDRNKLDALQKENKTENGTVEQNEIFVKGNTPWRYIPTSSSVEYLTMGEQIKFFRDTVDVNTDQVSVKTPGEIGITKTYQIHMQPEIVRKRYVNSMMCSSYAAKPERVKNITSRMTKELQQQTMERKQAALERELRLQKSLSEECEDLGVDEPSTSDLFPEADLLFEPSHSFDQNSQDATCSQTVGKNYSRSNFKPLDSSSNSADADFAKVAPVKMKISVANTGQKNSFLLEHQRCKISSAVGQAPSGASLRSPNTFIDQAQDDKKGTSPSDFDNNSEFIFNTTSFSRSVDDSCLGLVFENTDKNSNKNGKDECLHETPNSNSNSFESSGEQTPIEASPGLPSHTTRSKFRKKFAYTNCETKDDSEKLTWESELEHSTTEDEMQFTEDDSSQSQLDSFHGSSVNINDPLLRNMLKKTKQDSLEGNGLHLSVANLPDLSQDRKTECVLNSKKRSASQSARVVVQHIETYTNFPASPSEEHSGESNKSSTRRLSLRGHVKKNCPCCNGKTMVETVQANKKARTKIDHLKTVKVNKKTSVIPKSNKNQSSKRR